MSDRADSGDWVSTDLSRCRDPCAIAHFLTTPFCPPIVLFTFFGISLGIILAGDRSGTGKTTVTLALLAALTQKGYRVQSFKVGPDYIDPMFHRAVTQRPCYNLDPILTSVAYVQQSYRQHSASADCTVVEGVMGLFDGATGDDDTASTAHVARIVEIPVLLVVDCSRMARSIAALVQGYRTFDRRVHVAGVILNRVGSDRHLLLVRQALAQINMPIVGVMRRQTEIHLPSRHLGLIPTGELKNFRQIVERLAVLGETCFDWPQLMSLLRPSRPQSISSQARQLGGGMPTLAPLHLPKSQQPKKVTIAVAQDDAFNFYYPDNLAMLAAQGAQLIGWSPLKDQTLPEAHGLYFGGGFPEVFAAQLSDNQPMRQAVLSAIRSGMPTYAECGGLMYLSCILIDEERQAWPMVNAIGQTVKMGNRLKLGYQRIHAQLDGPILRQGEWATGHEFHKSEVVDSLTSPAYLTQRYWASAHEPTPEGYLSGNLQASYVHLHWGHRPEIAQRFVTQCHHYRPTACP